MELYLFRHGQKEKNNCFIGQTDVGLTPRGLQQNKKIREELHKRHVDKIFTSDLRRTFISIKKGIKEKALREIHFGAWEQLSWGEIEKQYPEEARKYLTNPLHFCFPQGESYKEVEKRVIHFIEWLRKKKWKQVGIVTHQGVIRTIIHYIRGDDFWNVHVASGEGVNITL